MQVFFKDKTFTKKVQVDVPIGHRKRRAEGAHLLKSKFQISIEKRLKDKQIDQLLLLYDNPKDFINGFTLAGAFFSGLHLEPDEVKRQKQTVMFRMTLAQSLLDIIKQLERGETGV